MRFSAFLILMFLINNVSAQEKKSYAFDFGSDDVESGFIGVGADRAYTVESGYGFDFDTLPQAVNSGKGSSLKRDAVTSTKPFYFSVKVPEGNYKVTVYFGSKVMAGLSTVKAESRRLMLENISTKKGQYKKEVFVVNIKDKQITSDKMVSLKPREYNKLDWDDKLTLEFDLHTLLYALKIEPVENQTTVFLAGNSTVVNQDEEPWASWGQMIPRFFKPGVAIANHAESGLTLGSFMGSKRLDKILSIAKPGDFLFIEFGHNDQKEKGPNDGAYKSYTERLVYFIKEFRAIGGKPVIVTSTSRRAFDEAGNVVATLGDYPEAARKVANDLAVPLIDLNRDTKLFYKALGEEGSKQAFVHYPANTFPGQARPLADNTHFNPYGAYEISKMIVNGIKDNRLSIAKYLKKVETFNPAQPDSSERWTWPNSPKNNIVKPDGN